MEISGKMQLKLYAVATFTDGTKQGIAYSCMCDIDGDLTLLKPILGNIMEQKFPKAEKVDFVTKDEFVGLVKDMTVLNPIHDAKTTLLQHDGTKGGPS